MTTTWWLSLLALLPIALVLLTMMRFGWSGARAGVLGWAAALVLAILLFRAPLELLIYAHIRSLLLSLYVLYIIWMALLLYHVVNEANAIQDISAGIARLTGEPLIQLLILSWVFSSFLQGITGFGVPVAVVTPLLVGLGFDPVLSLVATGIAHTWAVTFGSAGSSFYALVAVTGLPGESLAPASALMLGAVSWLCGGSVAHIYSGWSGVIRSLLFVLLIGAIMAGGQYLLAVNGLWAIAAFGGGLLGMVASVPLARLPMYRGRAAVRVPGEGKLRERLPISISAYVILLVVVLAGDLVPWLESLLNRVELNYLFPTVSTGLGWVVEGGPGRSLSIFGHAGALIAYASILSYLVYRVAGRYRPGAAQRIGNRTLDGSKKATWPILALVAMALVMDNSGMIFAIADGLRQLLPAALYPLAAPFIGALGAFMTGSNTNSNVIFAPLQQQVAQLLHLSVPAILATQTTGGALGSSLAPAKILVGASTANAVGREGEVLARSIPYALMLLLFAGGFAYLLLEFAS